MHRFCLSIRSKNLSFTQRFIVCLDLHQLLFFGQCVYAALVEYTLDFLIKNLIDSSELVADQLRPDEVSLGAFGCPAGRCLCQESAIIADLIPNFDDFGMAGYRFCFDDLIFFAFGLPQGLIVSALHHQISHALAELLLQLLGSSVSVLYRIVQDGGCQYFIVLHSCESEDVGNFKWMVNVWHVSCIFSSLGLVFF